MCSSCPGQTQAELRSTCVIAIHRQPRMAANLFRLRVLHRVFRSEFADMAEGYYRPEKDLLLPSSTDSKMTILIKAYIQPQPLV